MSVSHVAVPTGSSTDSRRPALYIAGLGKTAERKCFKWATKLRRLGIWVEMDYGSSGLKVHMKKADRFKAKKVLIVGDDELETGKGILRDMDAKIQQEVVLQDFLSNLMKAL